MKHAPSLSDNGGRLRPPLKPLQNPLTKPPISPIPSPKLSIFPAKPLKPLYLRAGMSPSPAKAASQDPQPTTLDHCFSRSQYGFLSCDDVMVQDILDRVEGTPFYLYSKHQITRNVEAWRAELEGLEDAVIGHAMIANNNLAILKHLGGLGCAAMLVNGDKLRCTLHAEFHPSM